MVLSCLLACRDRLLHATTATYDSRSEYPVERLLAFCEYSQSTPRWRVFLVLVLTSAPALVLLLLFDVMPLRDPSDGWSANYFFWIRSFIGSIVVASGIIAQIQKLVLDKALSKTSVAMVLSVVSIGYTATQMLAARFWVFPIPFMMTLGGLPFTLFLNVSMLLAIGWKNRAVLKKINYFNNIVSAQTLMLLVYPAYNVAFLSLNGAAQVPFVALLPLIRLSFKYMIARVSADLGDLAPAIVSSVDLFDALYTTKCMQSAGSIWVGVVIIALDMLQNCSAIASLLQRFRVLSASHASANRDMQVDTARLIALALELMSSERASRTTTEQQQLCIHSRNKFTISREAKSTLNRLEQHQRHKDTANTVSVVPPAPTHSTKKTSKYSHRSVVPLSGAAQASSSHSESTPAPESHHKRETLNTRANNAINTSGSDASSAADPCELIKGVAKLLHQSESVVLVEFIETAVPVFYSIYIVILYHLPNAKYYPDMQRFDAAQLQRMVANILVYALLELLSLVFVNAALKRKFGFSAFYQLAFTLESEWLIFQSNFVSWIVLVFQFLLQHNGADFTFHFAWIKQP